MSELLKTIKAMKHLFSFLVFDIGGNRITTASGKILYEDDRFARLVKGGKEDKDNWDASCPAPRLGQRAELWDLVVGRQTYMIATSTVLFEGRELIQLHHLIDTSAYGDLLQDMASYSKALKEEKERDALTGLYNKGKFLELKASRFAGQDAIAVFNFDVNNLKEMNDNHGHEAGDKLLKKAADSLHAVEESDIMAFRVGGDEFLLVGLRLDRAAAEALKRRWEEALERLNAQDDGVSCVMACGMVCGERGYDLDELLVEADERMYRDKVAKKNGALPR